MGIVTDKNLRGVVASGGCKMLWVSEEGRRRVRCWKDPGIASMQQN